MKKKRLKPEAVAQQHKQFEALIQSLGRSSLAHVYNILNEREDVNTEPDLPRDTLTRLKKR